MDILGNGETPAVYRLLHEIGEEGRKHPISPNALSPTCPWCNDTFNKGQVVINISHRLWSGYEFIHLKCYRDMSKKTNGPDLLTVKLSLEEFEKSVETKGEGQFFD